MDKYKPMQIKVLNINKYISNNHLIPVTSAKKIDVNNQLHADGLFSETIFGRIGSMDRMNRCSYIDLHCKCLQPYLCLALERSSSDFANTIIGKQKWIVNGKNVTKSDNDDDPTGLSFIYHHWEVFTSYLLENKDSKSKEEYLDLIKKYNKDELFVDKWLVIPAGYRGDNY